MLSVLDKLKKTKTTIEYHNVGIFPNSNRKIVERVYIHGYSVHYNNAVRSVICKCWHVGFSPGAKVVSTNKTGNHDITKILLKVTLNTITLTLAPYSCLQFTVPK
jgi:hypothetical protein